MHQARIALCALAAWLGVGMQDAAAAGDVPVYPTSRLGYRTAPMLLLSRPDVCAELRLSHEQSASAQRMLAELYERARTLRGKRGPDAVAARRAIDEAQERWIETQLAQPQRDRLMQIELQWEGPSALVSRTSISDALKLSSDQRAALRRAVSERDKKRAEGKAAPADEQQLAKQSLALLSPDQRALWLEMLGKPFLPRDPEVQRASHR